MNLFKVVEGSVSLLRLPLRSVFATALGRKSETVNAAVTLRLAGGFSGYGEASTSLVFADHSPERLRAELGALLPLLLGKDARGHRTLSRAIWDRARFPEAANALECALLEALLQGLGVPMREWFGGASRRLETSFTLSAVGPGETRLAAARAAALGFRRLKIKVGTGEGDLARVLAAREGALALGLEPELWLDGNQRLGRAGALRLLEACRRRGARLALLEQPLPRGVLREAAALRRECPVPLAADEDVRGPEDALRVLDASAADVLNVKLAKMGPERALEIVALARSAGARLMIGCMQESARGLSASVHLALGTGAFSYADLDSDALLDEPQPPGNFSRHGPFLA